MCLVIGASVGIAIARRIKITSLPQMVRCARCGSLAGLPMHAWPLLARYAEPGTPNPCIRSAHQLPAPPPFLLSLLAPLPLSLLPPHLQVAAFHSLVGLAAVCTSISSYLAGGAAGTEDCCVGWVVQAGCCCLHRSAPCSTVPPGVLQTRTKWTAST